MYEYAAPFYIIVDTMVDENTVCMYEVFSFVVTM